MNTAIHTQDSLMQVDTEGTPRETRLIIANRQTQEVMVFIEGQGVRPITHQGILN